MKFTKSFSEMQDEINKIFIQHGSAARVDKVYQIKEEEIPIIYVKLDCCVGLSELESISILTGDNNITVDVDVDDYDIELTIVPNNWIDNSI